MRETQYSDQGPAQLRSDRGSEVKIEEVPSRRPEKKLSFRTKRPLNPEARGEGHFQFVEDELGAQELQDGSMTQPHYSVMAQKLMRGLGPAHSQGNVSEEMSMSKPHVSFEEERDDQQSPLYNSERPGKKFLKRKSITIEVVADEVNPEYLKRTMKQRYRWLMLFFCCTFVISNYFCYDNPAAMETQIEARIVDETEYGLLYTVYAIPNVFLPLVGGIFLDKIGVRNGLLLFTVLLCIGQGVVMLGGYRLSFSLMLVGRVIFGIGCESMYVGQSAMVSAWFINFELPLAIAMISCVPLLGSFLGGAVVPSVYNLRESFGDAFGIGFLLCLVSLALVIMLSILDFKAAKYDQRVLKEFTAAREAQEKIKRSAANIEESAIEFYKKFKQGEDIEETFKCRDLKDFELPFWLTCLSCFCTYIAIINSIVIGSKVLQQRFGYSEVEAGYYFTLPYMIAAIFSPLLGWFVEKYGKRMTITLTGSFLMTAAHVIQLCLPDCERCWVSLLPLIILGLSYTTYAVVLWGALPYMVEARALGTAFGICTMFQNLGTVIAPPTIGLIQGKTASLAHSEYGYAYVELFFIAISILAFCFNFGVYLYDKLKRENLLQSTRPMQGFEKYIQFKEDVRQYQTL